jgi:hypothetical protein
MATDLIEELRHASGQMAQYPGGTVFRVEPLPQPGEGCRERFAVWHSYVNGVPISKSDRSYICRGGRRDAPEIPLGLGRHRRSQGAAQPACFARANF